MQPPSRQEDSQFRKADFVIKYVAFVCLLAVYMPPAFDLLLPGVNAKREKYTPEELGQVTPARTRYALA